MCVYCYFKCFYDKIFGLNMIKMFCITCLLLHSIVHNFVFGACKMCNLHRKRIIMRCHMEKGGHLLFDEHWAPRTSCIVFSWKQICSNMAYIEQWIRESKSKNLKQHFELNSQPIYSSFNLQEMRKQWIEWFVHSWPYISQFFKKKKPNVL